MKVFLKKNGYFLKEASENRSEVLYGSKTVSSFYHLTLTCSKERKDVERDPTLITPLTGIHTISNTYTQ